MADTSSATPAAADAGEGTTDPVAYAQALIAQGYDPVQAFLYVGFTLEQVAAAGYDTSTYLAQVAAAADPAAYAAQLIAQGYDEATAYQAAGLAPPTSTAEGAPSSSTPATAAPVSTTPSNQLESSDDDLEFADAELLDLEEAAHGHGHGHGHGHSHAHAPAPAPEPPKPDPKPVRTPAPVTIPLPPPPPAPADLATGGWTAQSRAKQSDAASSKPSTSPEPWRTPMPRPVTLPEPVSVVPRVDDVSIPRPSSWERPLSSPSSPSVSSTSSPFSTPASASASASSSPVMARSSDASADDSVSSLAEMAASAVAGEPVASPFDPVASPPATFTTTSPAGGWRDFPPAQIASESHERSPFEPTAPSLDPLQPLPHSVPLGEDGHGHRLSRSSVETVEAPLPTPSTSAPSPTPFAYTTVASTPRPATAKAAIKALPKIDLGDGDMPEIRVGFESSHAPVAASEVVLQSRPATRRDPPAPPTTASAPPTPTTIPMAPTPSITPSIASTPSTSMASPTPVDPIPPKRPSLVIDIEPMVIEPAQPAESLASFESPEPPEPTAPMVAESVRPVSAESSTEPGLASHTAEVLTAALEDVVPQPSAEMPLIELAPADEMPLLDMAAVVAEPESESAAPSPGEALERPSTDPVASHPAIPELESHFEVPEEPEEQGSARTEIELRPVVPATTMPNLADASDWIGASEPTRPGRPSSSSGRIESTAPGAPPHLNRPPSSEAPVLDASAVSIASSEEQTEFPGVTDSAALSSMEAMPAEAVLDVESVVANPIPDGAATNAAAAGTSRPKTGATGAVGVLEGPAWPTRSELSEWTSADKGEYAAWSLQGGIEAFPDVSFETPGPTPHPGANGASSPHHQMAATPLDDAEEWSADSSPSPAANVPLQTPRGAPLAPLQETSGEWLPNDFDAAEEAVLPTSAEEPKLTVTTLPPSRQPTLPSVVIDEAMMSQDSGPIASIDESEFDPSNLGRASSGPPAPVIDGERRVIVHLVEGAVKRGTVHDLDLGAASVVIQSQTGITEEIARERVKAIFFMLPAGAAAPMVEGSKLRITFHDGRQIVGFAPTYDPKASGFFLVPADARTSTDRIYIFQAAVRNVAQG